MATFSDQPNPAPYRLPPAAGPAAAMPPGPGGAMGGSKQLKIRGMANAAKQRGARQLAQFKQYLTGTQHGGITASAAARLLVDKRDEIDRLTRKVLFG